jgi:hypothetical protein
MTIFGEELIAVGQFTAAGSDLTSRIANWFDCQPSCPGDLNGNGTVDSADLAILLGAWGACP